MRILAAVEEFLEDHLLKLIACAMCICIGCSLSAAIRDAQPPEPPVVNVHPTVRESISDRQAREFQDSLEKTIKFFEVRIRTMEGRIRDLERLGEAAGEQPPAIGQRRWAVPDVP